MYERARRSLSGGVASSYQLRDPWPIYLVSGEGPRVTDVDGNRYWDFHNGFGSMVQGHANPAIVEALRARAPLGTHFAAVTEDTVAVAENLAEPLRARTLAVRELRLGGDDGRDPDRAGADRQGHDREDLRLLPRPSRRASWSRSGCPTRRSATARTSPRSPTAPASRKPSATSRSRFRSTTLAAMERRIERLFSEGRPPACVIMEAAMMNLGVVLPEPGYLEAVRELTERHGVVLIFDEVKTGLAIAAGGATERFGVKPDMVTLAKTLGGGLPSGAIGGTEQAMSVVEDGSVYQVGTYNGNPLTMAAARASLERVLTPAGLQAPRRAQRPHRRPAARR